jgi:hypothetical protein
MPPVGIGQGAQHVFQLAIGQPGGMEADPFLDKFQPEHISQLLQIQSEKDKADASNSRLKAWLLSGLFVVVILFLGGIVWLGLAYKQTAIIGQIAVPFVSLLVGLLGGIGIGKSLPRSPQDVGPPAE